MQPFSSIYRHGLARLAVAIPAVRIAEPAFNAERTIALARRAAAEGAILVLFPELGISAYSNDDLFQQTTLLDAVDMHCKRLCWLRKQ
jgi:Predicted amidohydrolase